MLFGYKYAVSYVGPSHHGLARPRVANRGGGIQVWKLAVNISNKQSRTTAREWSSSLGLSGGLTTLRIKPSCYEMLHRASDLEGSCENGNEPSGSIKGG
jgi:hypothetical protein